MEYWRFNFIANLPTPLSDEYGAKRFVPPRPRAPWRRKLTFDRRHGPDQKSIAKLAEGKGAKALLFFVVQIPNRKTDANLRSERLI